MKQVLYRTMPFAFILLLGFAFFGLKTGENPAATTTLNDLQSVEQLKALFNRDADIPRLVLLLSPT